MRTTMPHAVRAAAFLALLAGPALAAEPAKPPVAPAAPGPVSSAPSVTTASYGDWTARCEQGTGDHPQRVCEAVQTVQLHDKGVAVAQIAFGHAASADPLKLVVVLPVDVWFPSTVKIAAGDKDASTLDLNWRRCLPVGCFAESAAADDPAKRLRGEAGQGRLTYKDGMDRDVTLPVSFRGLAQALEALAKM